MLYFVLRKRAIKEVENSKKISYSEPKPGPSELKTFLAERHHHCGRLRYKGFDSHFKTKNRFKIDRTKNPSENHKVQNSESRELAPPTGPQKIPWQCKKINSIYVKHKKLEATESQHHYRSDQLYKLQQEEKRKQGKGKFSNWKSNYQRKGTQNWSAEKKQAAHQGKNNSKHNWKSKCVWKKSVDQFSCIDEPSPKVSPSNSVNNSDSSQGFQINSGTNVEDYIWTKDNFSKMFGNDKQGSNPFGQPGPSSSGQGDKSGTGNLFQGSNLSGGKPFGGAKTDNKLFGSFTSKPQEKTASTEAKTLFSGGTTGLFGKPTTWPASSTGAGSNESQVSQTTSEAFGQKPNVFGSRTVLSSDNATLRARAKPASSENIFAAKSSPEKGQSSSGGTQDFGTSKFGPTGSAFGGALKGKQEGGSVFSQSGLFGSKKDDTTADLRLKFSTPVSKQLSTESQDTPITSSVIGALFGKTNKGDQRGETERKDETKHTSEETGEVTSERVPTGALRKPKIKREGLGMPRAKPSGPGLFGKAITGLTGRSVTESRSRRVVTEEDGSPPKQANAGAITRRRSTGTKEKNSIVVKGIPDQYNTKQWLTNHFKRYGKMTKVLAKPTTKAAFIYYEDHASANRAKRRGAFIGHDEEPLSIFFSSNSPRVSSKSSSRTASTSSVEGKLSESKPTGSRSITRTTEKAPSLFGQDDGEVNEELKALQGTADYDEEQVTILDRPTFGETLQRPSIRGVKTERGRAPLQIQKDKQEKPRSTSPYRKMGARTSREPSPSKPREGPLFGKPQADPAPGPSKPQNVPASVLFRSLLKAVGTTSAEKIDILDSRDKLLRQSRGSGKSHADLATAEAVHGTCQDMCPEKERYLREDRRRLSVFEFIPGTDIGRQNPKIDHAKAVKEYSRSSADQDMPLPNELRPPHVLNMTMDYLMNNILDQGEDGKWGDWYDFLWNRTRGIRKDITQQMMCNETSVDLSEKCARFHIYCAERLIEEGMMDFDTKINNENLTKCLQTLKELYSDLEKQNILCPNEGEFRGYLILMNLNGGDILRETQQLREELRRHPAVVFALKAHSALNCNNYVRFFNLVRRATFLNACIMHRYFNQMRSSALNIFCKVYTPGKRSLYPLSGLMDKLGFENEDEVARCCEHHGLTVEDDNVWLDKRAFVLPESAFPRRRAINLIETKLHTSVGEAVNGGPLPANEIHTPTFSFDDHGRFIPPADLDSSLSEDRETGEQSEQQAIQESPFESSGEDRLQESPTKTPTPIQTAYPNESIKVVAKSICLEVVDEMAKEVTVEFVLRTKAILATVKKMHDDTIDSTINSMLREITSEVINEEKAARAEIERRKQQSQTEAATVIIVDQLVEEVVTQQSQIIARDEIRLAQMEEEERKKRCSELIVQELLMETLDEEILSVSREVHDKDVKQRLEQLEEASKNTLLLRQLRFFNRWKGQYARRQRLKGSMLNFPSAPPLRNTTEQLKALIPESEGVLPNCISLDSRTKLTLKSQAQLEEGSYRLSLTIALHNFIRHLKHEKAWAPLDLVDAVGKSLLTQTKQNSSFKGLYWKLLISLPDKDTNADPSESVQWMTTKFRKGAVPLRNVEAKSEVLALYTSQMEGVGRDIADVSICVRTSEGIVEDFQAEEIQEKRYFQGSSAILFFMSLSDTSNEFWEMEKHRLESFLSTIKPIPALPLVIVVHSGDNYNKDFIGHKLNLRQHRVVSEYKIFFIGNIEELESTRELYASVQWLAEKSPSPPHLDYEPIREYIENGLGSMFYSTLYQDLATRRKHGQLDQNPQAIIALYNAVIRQLSNVATSNALTAYSWPMPEFVTHEEFSLPAADWNSEHQFDFLEGLIMSLALPEFRFDNIRTESWEAAVGDVWKFVSALTSDSDISAADLHSRINWILQKTLWEFEDNCDFFFGKSGQPFYVNMPWSDIMLTCIHFKLATLDWRCPSDEEESSAYEIMIHYKSEVLEDDFKQPGEWTEVIKRMHEADQVTINDSLYKSAVETSQQVKRKHSGESDDSPPKQAKLHDITANDLNSTTSTKLDFTVQSELDMEVAETAQTLKNDIAIEKQKQSEYEAYLQKALAGDQDSSDFDNDSLNISSNSTQRYSAFSSPVSVSGKKGRERNLRDSFFPSGFGQFSTPKSRGFKSFGSPICREPLSDSMVVNLSVNESGNMSLQDEMKELEGQIESHSREDAIFEMKLKSALIETPF